MLLLDLKRAKSSVKFKIGFGCIFKAEIRLFGWALLLIVRVLEEEVVEGNYLKSCF